MFDSLVNFRPIGGELYKNNDGRKDPNLLKICAYRSSRPDEISPKDFELIQSQLGIRYIIDLRNHGIEYKRTSGAKLVDKSPEKSILKVASIVEMERKNKKEPIWSVQLPKGRQSSFLPEDVFTHYMLTLTGYNFFMNFLKDNTFSICKRIQGVFIFLLSTMLNLKYHTRFVTNIYEGNLSRFYVSIIESGGVGFRTALETIHSHGNTPFIVCCQAGKDRTGILSALILSICGFSEETICSDYSLTEVGLPPSHPELREYPEGFRVASKDIMHRLLQYIDRKYGSVSEYLVSVGFPIEKQEELKRNLLQSDGSQ